MVRLSVAALVLGLAPAFADKVGLKNGNVLNGRIVQGAPPPLAPVDQDPGAGALPKDPPPGGEGQPASHVTIRLDLGGQMTIPAGEVAWIEDVEDPPEVYEPPKPEAKKGTAAAKKPPPAAKKPPPKKGG